MLKSFEVSNFESFKNRTKFDLEKTNYQVLASTNVNGDILKGPIISLKYTFDIDGTVIIYIIQYQRAHY